MTINFKIKIKNYNIFKIFVLKALYSFKYLKNFNLRKKDKIKNSELKVIHLLNRSEIQIAK